MMFGMQGCKSALHGLQVPTGSVEIFTAGYPGDSIVVSSSPILLSATVLKAGAPALTNTSLQQDYVPFIVILTG